MHENKFTVYFVEYKNMKVYAARTGLYKSPVYHIKTKSRRFTADINHDYVS